MNSVYSICGCMSVFACTGPYVVYLVIVVVFLWVWRPEVNTGCLSSSLHFEFLRQGGSLNLRFIDSKADWPMSFRIRLCPCPLSEHWHYKQAQSCCACTWVLRSILRPPHPWYSDLLTAPSSQRGLGDMLVSVSPGL